MIKQLFKWFALLYAYIHNTKYYVLPDETKFLKYRLVSLSKLKIYNKAHKRKLNSKKVNMFQLEKYAIYTTKNFCKQC